MSREIGCNIETIRYYERIGIFPNPPRSEGGHRLYGEIHRARLLFIRRSRELGFTLKQIRDLLGLIDSGKYTCGEVKIIAQEHLQEIRSKISVLNNLEKTLSGIVAKCGNGTIPECPIIDVLSK